jgi:teichoic acid transport system ATP-binding protein
MGASDGRSMGGQHPQLAVSVRGLHVRYRVFEEQQFTVRQLAARGFRNRRAVEVHALDDVDLQVWTGEAIGVVGANGSGKSTLLRAIAGLQSKAAGTVLVRGQPHLLGVHAALKPQLSGYRNILLGGLAMGLNQTEIEELIDDVIAFSGLDDAIGRPMATYSSGMRARLAFSIATLRVPEVLLIDEALAVGDQEFRERSLARIKLIREEAHSVIMVTHNLNEIRQTCDRAVWLDHGRVRAEGDVGEVLEQYERDAS